MTFKRLEKKKITPEAALTKQVRYLLDLHGIWHYKNWAGLGSKPGVSDILACYRGRFIAIEIKAPKGRVSTAQMQFLAEVKINGGLSYCVRSVDDIMDVIAEIREGHKGG